MEPLAATVMGARSRVSIHWPLRTVSNASIKLARVRAQARSPQEPSNRSTSLPLIASRSRLAAGTCLQLQWKQSTACRASSAAGAPAGAADDSGDPAHAASEVEQPAQVAADLAASQHEQQEKAQPTASPAAADGGGRATSSADDSAVAAAGARVLAQLAGVFAAIASFLKEVLGVLGEGPTWVRRRKLKSLAAAAEEDPADPRKVLAYLSALQAVDPAAVVEFVEGGAGNSGGSGGGSSGGKGKQRCAVDQAVAVEYLKALVASNEIGRFAEQGSAGNGGRSLSQHLEQLRVRMDSGDAGAEAAGETSMRPLHVVLQEAKPKGAWWWLAATVSQAFSMLFMVVTFSFLWLFGVTVVRRYSAGGTMSSSSGLPSAQANAGVPGSASASSAYAPKEYNKESLPERSIKTFNDVKGCDEAKAELEEIVAFLKNPDRFTRLGGKLPKGVLLSGPPGTGKTLLARATAGEAGVPFFYRAGSEFEEMYVGVGSRRVRKLFGEAKKKAPCIVFIDEIDAIGGSRKSWENHTRKTLNQLLVEMDGFESNDGVIVMACTNIPESLDPALTRPGRFDRMVAVPLPDVKGRTDILSLYLKDKPLSPEVEASYLARRTPGFSGAQLFNLINEAALLAAKTPGAERITAPMFDEARDKILMGAARTSRVLSEKCRRLTAYHEAGHAIVALNTPGAMPIHKATIIPRGHALGMVSQVPDEDQVSMTKQEMLAEIDVCMGGRVAEELIFGEDQVTSGATSDFEAATRYARSMVTHYGMGQDIGPMYVSRSRDSDVAPSSDLLRRVDTEVERLLRQSYARVRSMITEREADLHTVASALLEHETLSLDNIRTALSGQPLASPPSGGSSGEGPAGRRVSGDDAVVGEQEGGGLIGVAAAAAADKNNAATAGAVPPPATPA